MEATIGKVFDSVSTFFSGVASGSSDEFPLCDTDIISVTFTINLIASVVTQIVRIGTSRSHDSPVALSITSFIFFGWRFFIFIIRDVRKSLRKLRKAKTKGLRRNPSCDYHGLLFIRRCLRIYSVG